ncbi:MAG: histidine kinase [Sideroxydans sp.]|nr:histidine kinase [Sideroxydans sp.]
MRIFSKAPLYAWLQISLIGIACGIFAIWMALQTPWLGVTLTVAEEGKSVKVVEHELRFLQQIPAGARVVRLISATNESIDVLPTDLIEEPDFFDTYAEIQDFFTRQSAFATLLQSPQVTLEWQDEAGLIGSSVVHPSPRPLASLPAVFWFQLGVGLVGLMLASWIYLLRKDDWGARMFGLSGAMFPIFTLPAAIYSTRELALPGEMFRWLASLNHLGAFMFGCALVAIFATYPRPLLRVRYLLWLWAFFGLWLAADVWRWAPNQDWGSRIPVMIEMVLAIVFAGIQWRKSRGHPLERAALRWFTLSLVVGSGSFIFTTFGSQVLGLFPMPQQGFAFGYFLIIYLGIALGLRRYQLFDLNQWAYRGYLWVGGAMLVLLLDMAFAYFGVTQGASLGLSLLLAVWLYFPLRMWLWRRLVNHSEQQFELLLPELSAVAYAATPQQQVTCWETLLNRVFSPLELNASTAHVTPGIADDGLSLNLAASGVLPAYTLRYAKQGRQLFSSRDAAFALSMTHLLDQVLQGRASYEQGVTQERLRISRDLHDNLGARLLKLIHHLRGSPDASIAQEAMQDLRTSIAAMNNQPIPLMSALADWRAEANARCDAALCALHWEQGVFTREAVLSARNKAMLESVLREMISNALKHAAPKKIVITVLLHAATLYISVENDGVVRAPAHWVEGYGLRNMRGRIAECGGIFRMNALDTGVQLSVEIPQP